MNRARVIESRPAALIVTLLASCLLWGCTAGPPTMAPFIGNNKACMAIVVAPNAGAACYGTVLSEDGYILTGYGPASKPVPKLHVMTSDLNLYEASVVGSDPRCDLALIKIDADVRLTPAVFGDSDTVRVGDWLLLLGGGSSGVAAVDASLTVSCGIVGSAPETARGVQSQQAESDRPATIQFDAPSMVGSAGAVVIDTSGRIVGICIRPGAEDRPDEGKEGIGYGITFALPANAVKEVVARLGAGKNVQLKTAAGRGRREVPMIGRVILPNRSGVVSVAAPSSGAPAVSGTVVSTDGYILTSLKVASAAKTLQVTGSDGRSWKGRMVGSDPAWDLALIKVDGAVDLRPVRFGDSSKLSVGNWVMLLGNTFAFTAAQGDPAKILIPATPSATVGVVSAVHRMVYADAFQFDAPSTVGSVGGPVINEQGEVVGLCTWVGPQPGLDKGPWGLGYGLSFALPINHVKGELLARMKAGATVTHGFLGVRGRNMTPQEIKDVGQAGVKVDLVMDNSPALKAGIKVDDIITDIEGTPVASIMRVNNVLGSTLSGQTVTVSIIRSNRKLMLQPTLIPRP